MKPSQPMPMIELLLIRHGETEWNAERRLQGHSDIPLNQTGMHQATALGAALQHEKLDVIISSDLLRAQQTARAIGRFQDQDIITDPMWRERCYGGFESLLYSDIAARFPMEYAAWQAHDVDAHFPEGERKGETIRQFQHRIAGAVQKLFKLAAHSQSGGTSKIAVVAHGGVLECIYRIALNLELDAPREVSMLNASINRFTLMDEQLRLTLWGDVRHLTALTTDLHLHAALDEL